jgi:transcriptional regulator with XRE-family HTH domain
MLLSMKDLRKIIGDNLSELRKRRGLTQFELAEKFNYTDRAISKWENGDTLPDVEVLYNLCEFYGVTIDYLTHEENAQFKTKGNPLNRSNRIVITALVLSIVWMLATVVFVYCLIRGKGTIWQSFVWGVPLSAVVLIYFNHIYFHRKITAFIGWSLLIWSLITATFLSVGDYQLWPLYFIGVPAQISMIFWLNIKPSQKQKKEK